MSMENPFLALTFIGGPAILTNACAIMQNSATMRYSLAISQWREFRAAIAAHNDMIGAIYADPAAALALAERRIRLLLHGLNLLYGAVGLFGVTCLLGLAGAVLSAEGGGTLPVWVVVGTGGLGVVALLAATGLFMAESACATALLKLQLDLRNPPPG